MTDTTRPTVERTLRLAVTNRHITPAIERLALAILDRAEAAEVAIKRQAGAAKTLREFTLAEVQDLRDADRSEYFAAKSLQSEHDANAMLTDENDKLTAERDALQAEVARLKAAIKTVTETNDAFKRREIFNTDGTHSKHDRCIHGEPAYNDCAQCICEYLEAALEGKP
jgi:hypothetical protein